MRLMHVKMHNGEHKDFERCQVHEIEWCKGCWAICPICFGIGIGKEGGP